MIHDEPRYEGEGLPPPGDAFRISQSSLECYFRCGLCHRFNRELGYRSATVRMVVGTAVSEAARLDANEKKAGAPLPLPALVDAAVAGFDAELKETEVEGAPIEIGRGRDDAADAAREFGLRLSPTIPAETIVGAEIPIIATIDHGLELAGRPDLVTTDAVRDLKTGQPWTHDRADRSRQLTAYTLLHEAMWGEVPDRVAIDSIGRRRGAWCAETLWSHRDEDDRVRFVEAARRAKQGIEADVALPAPDGAWWCSADWCSHWNRCPARPGGKAAIR